MRYKTSPGLMKLIICLGLIALVIPMVWADDPLAIGSSNQTGIRLAVYRTNPDLLDEENLKILSKYDLVVLDFDCREEAIKGLKKLNPNLKLLMYFNPMELFDAEYKEENEEGGNEAALEIYALRPKQQQLYELVNSKRTKYWLRTTEGKKINWWTRPPMRMLNLSTLCPKVENQTWAEFVAEWHIKNTLCQPEWDGVLIDNAWENIYWMAESNSWQFDFNSDGKAESADAADQSWSDGISRMLSLIRKAKGSGFIMIGNKPCFDFSVSETGEKLCQGKLIEQLPAACFNHDSDQLRWEVTWHHYRQLCRRGLDQTIVESFALEAGSEAGRRFGLATAMLGDGLYAFKQDDFDWYPEFDQAKALGRPVGPAQGPWQKVFVQTFAEADGRKLPDGDTWFKVSGGKMLTLPGCTDATKKFEPGSYLITGRYRLSDRSQTILRLQIKSGPMVTKIKDFDRWPNSVIFKKFEITEPGTIELVALGSGSEVWLADLELWQIRSNTGLWWREYENGVVVCNPTNAAQSFIDGDKQFTVGPTDGAIISKKR